MIQPPCREGTHPTNPAMSSNYQEIIDRQIESRKAFGKMMLNWRLSNGWTQYTACEWAKVAGFEIISYGNLSVLEQGKAGELRQKAFFQLEELNRRLDHDKDLLAISDTKLRKLVENAKPILHESTNKPWDAVDFWSCYIGYLEVPQRYRFAVAPTLSSKAAKQLCNQWRYIFKVVLKQAIENGESAFDVLSTFVNFAPVEMRSSFSAMLLGEDYTPSQLQLLWIDGQYLPEAWMREWDNS